VRHSRARGNPESIDTQKYFYIIPPQLDSRVRGNDDWFAFAQILNMHQSTFVISGFAAAPPDKSTFTLDNKES